MPNFSGKWQLDIANSDFAGESAPTGMTQTIDHREPDLKITMSRADAYGEYTGRLKYTTDGTESENLVFGSIVKATARWEGDSLVISSFGRSPGSMFSLDDTWSLSADGKTLTISRRYAGRGGPLAQKLVFEKAANP